MIWTLLLVSGGIVALNGLALFSYWFGIRVGRRCACCDFDMDCRFCVAAKCKHARRTIDPFSDPVHRL